MAPFSARIQHSFIWLGLPQQVSIQLFPQNIIFKAFGRRKAPLIWLNFYCIFKYSIFQVLAINRCVDILSPKLAEKLFDGHRVWLWLSFCSIYALYWMVFEKPALFNGIYFAWFFNPFEGYLDDSEGKVGNVHFSH